MHRSEKMSPPNDQKFAAIALRSRILDQQYNDLCLRFQADEQQASRAVRPHSETMRVGGAPSFFGKHKKIHPCDY
jgi:hypothetical protein